MNLEKLYQQTILEYNRSDLKKEIDDPTDVERGHNPSCGDDLSLVLKIDGNKIVDASFLGNGCAISTASSAMLVELIKDKDVDFAKNLVTAFFKMMKSESLTEDERNILGNSEILEITKDMPARIKCSTLSWHSLKVILEKY